MKTPALVLAPGLMCDTGVWRVPSAALEAQLPVQVIDYGVRDTLPAMAEQLLSEAPASFALAGHSMGGRVALEVMRLAPWRVTHLALLNTGCRALPEGEAAAQERALRLGFLRLAREQGVAAMARSWLRNMVHPARRDDMELVTHIVSMFARQSVEVYAAQINALLTRPEALPLLATITCPTLVLTGDEDVNSPPAINHEMANAIAGAELTVVPDCGHMSLLERPELVTAALQRLLAIDVAPRHRC